MKRIIHFFLSISFLFVVGCKQNKEVLITVVQLPFVSFAYEEKEIVGYYFENEIVAKTTFKYNRGYKMTQDDIDYLYKNAKYIIPPLNGTQAPAIFVPAPRVVTGMLYS